LALLVAILSSPRSSWSSPSSKPRSKAITLLLLLKGRFIWTAFYGADFLSVLVSRLIASVLGLRPSTPLIVAKEDSSSNLFEGELSHVFLLADHLGDVVHGGW
jgi:hypothetical protein